MLRHNAAAWYKALGWGHIISPAVAQHLSTRQWAAGTVEESISVRICYFNPLGCNAASTAQTHVSSLASFAIT